MKSRSKLWKEIEALEALKPQTPEILQQIEELKEQRRNTPRIENKRNGADADESEADRLIDYWNSQY